MTLPPDPFDLVRTFYRALNAGDAAAMAACYAPSCTAEYVFFGDDGVCEGRERVRAGWAAEFAAYSGALPGGHRVEVDRIAGMETGWGWVRAEWRRAVREGASGPLVEARGYSDFWVEDGLIQRHRSIVRPSGEALGESEDQRINESENRLPAARPVVGVGAVIVVDGRVVLVRRRHEPLAGQWSLPGGALELGETLEAGVAREMREETGLIVDVGPIVEVFDRILLDETRQVCTHYVLVDYLCHRREGTLRAGGDVDAVALADPGALDEYRLTEKARGVIARALAMHGTEGADGGRGFSPGSRHD
jgi:8-oxo-dGTP diphosphatase